MSDDKGIPCEDETYVVPPGWNLVISINSKTVSIPPIVKPVGYYGDPLRVANDIVNKGFTHTHSEGVYTVYPAHRIDEVFIRRLPE
ncbi:hypothetical protein D3C75_1197920 [compost metagenome]